MVKVVEETEQENTPVDKIIAKQPKKPKGKKKGKGNQENDEQMQNNDENSLKNNEQAQEEEGNQSEQKQKSNAGRPKKNNVSIEQLDFSYSTTSYNISAFSVQFRKHVMSVSETNPQFNDKFTKYGKKNNKSYFTEKILNELKQKVNSKKGVYSEVEFKLYNFIENIKLQIYEYYDENDEQRNLESKILDQLFEKMSKPQDYQFKTEDFPDIEKCQVVKPFFWQNIASIMQYEKENKIDKSYLELLD